MRTLTYLIAMSLDGFIARELGAEDGLGVHLAGGARLADALHADVILSHERA